MQIATSVSITMHGKRHLDAAVGSMAFRDEFVSGKVKSWCKKVELLSQIALSHPHAAFAAYVHGQVVIHFQNNPCGSSFQCSDTHCELRSKVLLYCCEPISLWTGSGRVSAR